MRSEGSSGSSEAQREAYFCSNYYTVAAEVHSIFKVASAVIRRSSPGESRHRPGSASFELQSGVIRENSL